MKKFIKYLIYGISYGCIWFVVMGIVIAALGKGQVFGGTAFIQQSVAAVFVGIGFGTTAIIYENDRLPLGIQTTIHMGIGLGIFFAVGLWAEWVPVEAGAAAVVMFIIAEIIIGFIIWGCFCIYHLRLAKEINKKIREKQKA